MFDEIIAQLAPLAVAAVGIISTWALNELRKYLKSKTNNELVDIAYRQLDEITKSVVMAAEQSVNRVSVDGKLTKQEALQVKKDVMAQVKNQMPNSLITVLKASVDSLDEMLSSKIEEKVLDTKPVK